MLLLTFPLLAIGAPALLIVRGHFGLRMGVAMLVGAAALILLFTGDAFFSGVASQQRGHRVTTLLPPEVRSFLYMYLGLLLDLSYLIALQALIVLVRAVAPQAHHVHSPDAGRMLFTPLSVFSVLTDTGRIALLVYLCQPETNLLYRVTAYPPELLQHLAVMLGAALLVIGLSRVNDNVLPGLGAGSGRPAALWRFPARFGKPAAKSREGLAAIFSRRPKDLRAIARPAAKA